MGRNLANTESSDLDLGKETNHLATTVLQLALNAVQTGPWSKLRVVSGKSIHRFAVGFALV